ncbi:hypothetical protein SAMN04490179_0356 [Pseudomonas antarctica]|uniref:Uncharacterized protein n=2 Tax=Pseudomonas antarctica TaxID=219572 RepID=A0A1G9V2E3_9PSED|nr:hypothetical protein [Pseudomonas antarctica]KAF2408630.1 hypothetical protein PSAN_10260 [Pseudomonas antarctica]SDM66288.1 hypothetical protein SAMN04490179_0356 [Pseudomonas antarctica]
MKAFSRILAKPQKCLIHPRESSLYDAASSRHPPTYFAMNLTCQSLCFLTLLLSALTEAQPNSDAEPNNWTVEAPYPDSTIINARINGKATHAQKTSIAILQVACYSSPSRPMISLLTHTDELHFNPNIYEGPDARSSGPLSLTTGTLPARTYRVNGYYSAEPTQQHGVLFKFIMHANRQELREWIDNEVHDQLITMTLPSAIPGDSPLIAEFVLPQNSGGLHEIVKSCLNNRKNTPKKPS